jgi:hypothetical protein
MKFDRVAGTFEFVFDSDPSIDGSTEIFVPRLQYPRGCTFDVSGAEGVLDVDNQRLTIKTDRRGEVRVTIRRSN